MPHKILIIDDSEDIHPLIHMGLGAAAHGMTFHSAFNGEEGVAAARKYAPDLILLDVDMPVTDGFEVCRRLKADEQTASLPVIFLTGAASTAEKLKGLALGAVDYITKPFDAAEMCARVRSAIRMHDLLALLASQNALLQQAEVLERDRAAVLQAVAQNEDIEIVLGKLVQVVQRKFVNAVASVAVVSDGRTLHLAPNLPSDQILPMQNCVLRHTRDGNCKHPALAGTSASSVAIDDIATDPRWAAFRQACPDSGLRTSWSISIRTRTGGVLGLFMVCHRDEPTPDDSALAFLDLIAQLLNIALEHRHIVNQLAYRAHHDALTALPNRVLFEDRLGQAIARADRAKELVALLYIDLDRFKLVNDTLGHQTGDELLVQVVQRMQEHLRKSDTLARLGGDEFALLVPDMKDPAAAEIVAAKIVACLQAPFDIRGRELFITASIGIGIYPKDAGDSLTLQKSADAAMYRAKANGKNRSQPFSHDIMILSTERLELTNSLRRGLDNNELVLHYQPIVDHESKIVAFEALVRWHNPKLGLVPPAQFIPLAEETGLILQIGKWVIREAARRNKQWQAEGLYPVRVSVNVSAIQFCQPDFAEDVRAALDEAQLEPQWLELELTETILMQNFAGAAEKLNELRSIGVHVAIDDFGTGYSSLAYLQRLPVDTLKIDRSFVRGIAVSDRKSGDVNQTAVIRAVTLLARSLGLRTVAEGVESELQRAVLMGIGCDLLQGFLFARPCPQAEAEALLSAAAPLGTRGQLRSA